MARASTQGRLVTDHTDLRDTINRSQSRTLPQRTTLHEEEVSSADPTCLPKTDREGVEARIKNLENQIQKLGRTPDRDHVNTETESPFTDQVMRFTVPRKFKQPHLDSYNGSGSPVDHVRAYKAQMALATNADELLCLAFPSTLKGPAAQWFHSLKPRSVKEFKELSKLFISQFIGMHDRPQPDTQLLTVKQQKGESLKDFVDRFNQQKLQIYNLNETVAIAAFCSGVQHTKCSASFYQNRPTTLVELSERVGKYIDTEEFLKIKSSGFTAEESLKPKRKCDDFESGSGKKQREIGNLDPDLSSEAVSGSEISTPTSNSQWSDAR